MMDFIQQKQLDKTIRSYKQAVAKMFAVTDAIERTHYSEPLPLKFATLSKRLQYTAPMATRAWCDVKSLTDWGRPNHNAAKSTYSDFVRVKFYAEFPFESFGMDYGTHGCPEHTDDEGNYHEEIPAVPKKESKADAKVTLYLGEWGCSPKDWHPRRAELFALAPQLYDAVLKGTERADKEIASYIACCEKEQPAQLLAPTGAKAKPLAKEPVTPVVKVDEDEGGKS